MADVVSLDESSESVRYLRQKDRRLAKVIGMVGPITYRPYDDSLYDFMVREIIEQMLSTKAASKIYGRLKELCAGEVTPEAISHLSDEQIKGIGTSRPKTRYIRNLTDAFCQGRIVLSDLQEMSDAEAIRTLTQVQGIGTWTAKMVLIFALDRQDVLPFEDVAFLQGYGWMYGTQDRSPAAVQRRCKKWSPYSSVAARYLYRALDMGLTKEEFHLFK